jgi:hypothetical protein
VALAARGQSSPPRLPPSTDHRASGGGACERVIYISQQFDFAAATADRPSRVAAAIQCGRAGRRNRPAHTCPARSCCLPARIRPAEVRDGSHRWLQSRRARRRRPQTREVVQYDTTPATRTATATGAQSERANRAKLDAVTERRPAVVGDRQLLYVCCCWLGGRVCD